MYTLEEALAQWEEAGRYGTREERIRRGKLWQPYYSYLAGKKRGSPYHPSTQAQAVTAFLLREGILRQSDSVLDLGAGMGSYSIELAKHCQKATALDANGDALAVLADWSRQEDLRNIELCNTPWETFDPGERYDVTFSAMCPAICNQEEILRLESMTRRTACLLTVTRGSYEKCRMELMKGLPLQKPGGTVSEALHYMNVLYLMGRQPNVKCWTEEHTSTAKVPDLIERYRIYLQIFGVGEDVSVPYLESFFAQRAEDGLVRDECRMNYALIYWDVFR